MTEKEKRLDKLSHTYPASTIKHTLSSSGGVTLIVIPSQRSGGFISFSRDGKQKIISEISGEDETRQGN